MKQEKLSILFPRQDEVTYREIPEESWHDLGLDAITERIAAKPQEIPLIRRVMMNLTADPQVAAFRIDVFDDILRHPEIREKLMALLDKVRMFYDYGVVNRHEGDEAGVWDLMHRLEEYHDYILTVEAIRECLSEKDLVSEGLTSLRDTVNRIYEEKGFEALRKDVEEMRVAASEIRSLTVGINLNDRFEAVSMGLVSVNAKPFKGSGLLKNFLSAVIPRDEIRKEADWDGSYSYYPANSEIGLLASAEQFVETSVILRNPLAAMSLARIPEADGSSNVPRQMDSAASMLTSRIARRLKDTLGRYLNISVKEMADLIPELVFYTRWAEYIEKRRAEGWTFCKPEAGSGSPPAMEAEGIYNLKLIATEKPENVVPNDLAFDREKRVYVLTGANRGGKTTVTQAVGQLFLLAQSGSRPGADTLSRRRGQDPRLRSAGRGMPAVPGALYPLHAGKPAAAERNFLHHILRGGLLHRGRRGPGNPPPGYAHDLQHAHAQACTGPGHRDQHKRNGRKSRLPSRRNERGKAFLPREDRASGGAVLCPGHCREIRRDLREPDRLRGRSVAGPGHTAFSRVMFRSHFLLR